MVKLLRVLTVLLVFGAGWLWGAGQVASQCTGQGICCRANGFRCLIGALNYPTATCDEPSEVGKSCTVQGVGTGICKCNSSYTRTCNASCVSNACAAGDYLIEDTCYAPACTISDGGCGAGACPPTQMLRVNSCGGAGVCGQPQLCPPGLRGPDLYAGSRGGGQ